MDVREVNMMIGLEEKVKELAEILGISEEEAYKKALEEGIKDLRIKKAIELYTNQEISIKQAVRIAGISLGDWFKIARDKGLLVQISPEEIDEELKAFD